MNECGPAQQFVALKIALRPVPEVRGLGGHGLRLDTHAVTQPFDALEKAVYDGLLLALIEVVAPSSW